MRIPTVADVFRMGTEQVEALVALPESLARLQELPGMGLVSRLRSGAERDRVDRPARGHSAPGRGGLTP